MEYCSRSGMQLTASLGIWRRNAQSAAVLIVVEIPLRMDINAAKCKACGRVFTDTINTILYRSRSDADTWKKVIENTLDFVSIDKTANAIGLSHDHVFHMRHKILAALEELQESTPMKASDVNECDETFVLESHKGSKTPEDDWRGPRRHGARAQKRGISKEYICICTCAGREGCVMAKAVNRAKPDSEELKEVYKGCFNENTLILCDGLKSYQALEDTYGCPVRDVNREDDRFFHLNHVNGFHRFIKEKYIHYRGVATRYLNRYNTLFSMIYHSNIPKQEIYRTLCMDHTQNHYFTNMVLKSVKIIVL